jgi:hypothetical protein
MAVSLHWEVELGHTRLITAPLAAFIAALSAFSLPGMPSHPSISDMGQLRQGSISDMLYCITKDSPHMQHASDVGVNIVDGTAIIHTLKPRGSRTFQNYAQQIIIPHLLSQLESVDKLAVV